MNTKFLKALHQLDMGNYNDAESNIKQAISETSNIYELLEIYSCYAEVLYELNRYDDAMKCADFILNNNEDFDDGLATETALDIKKKISQYYCD